MMETQESNLFKDRGLTKFIWLGIGVVAFQFLIGVCVYYGIDKWEARGQFGDMFGVVNTVFSGLAFTGFLVALWMQSKELSLQRDELKLTRSEMESSRKVQEESVRTADRQARFLLASAIIQAKGTILQVYINADQRYNSIPKPSQEIINLAQENLEKINALVDEINKISEGIEIGDITKFNLDEILTQAYFMSSQ